MRIPGWRLFYTGKYHWFEYNEHFYMMMPICHTLPLIQGAVCGQEMPVELSPQQREACCKFCDRVLKSAS